MDFAKKQMKNMGWIEGKGLGVNENGIKKPIVPDIQLDKRGLGFTVKDYIQIDNQWWTEAYNIARKGLKPEYKITSLGVIINKKSTKNSDKKNSYNQHFVIGDTMLSNNEVDDGENLKKKNSKRKKCEKDDNNDNDDDDAIDNGDDVDSKSKQSSTSSSIDFNKIYKKNKNLTCHKAARLGIKMTGKMKRLQEQEEKFFENQK